MDTVLYPIRPTVRALIRKDNFVLAQEKHKDGIGRYLTLPGGKQEVGETATDALERECFEEIGAEVTVGALIHAAEVFKPKGEGRRHQVELIFDCTVLADYTPRMGDHPDRSQIGTLWADTREMAGAFRPGYMAGVLGGEAPVYLGVFDG
ncbi:MAG: NUDIX domain-containing protein [Pseudomonadota bacterium]